MKTPTLSRPVVWGIIMLMGMAVLLPAKELPAQGITCFAVDQF